MGKATGQNDRMGFVPDMSRLDELSTFTSQHLDRPKNLSGPGDVSCCKCESIWQPSWKHQYLAPIFGVPASYQITTNQSATVTNWSGFASHTDWLLLRNLVCDRNPGAVTRVVNLRIFLMLILLLVCQCSEEPWSFRATASIPFTVATSRCFVVEVVQPRHMWFILAGYASIAKKKQEWLRVIVVDKTE